MNDPGGSMTGLKMRTPSRYSLTPVTKVIVSGDDSHRLVGKLQLLRSETKSMVRRLHGRVECRIANSPVQVGARTCIRLLAFREIQGDLHFNKLEERFSATGRLGRFA